MIYLVFTVNLLLTSFIEGIIIYLLYRKKDFVYYSLLCNMLTNPAMNLLLFFAIKILGYGYYYLSLIVLEIIVVLVEAFIYRLLGNLKTSKSLMLSALLNLTSFLFGLLMYHAIIH